MKNLNMFTWAGCATAFLTSFSSFAVDVQISQLTDTPDPATRGGNVTYAISLLNGHNDTASNVTLAIPLPSTTSFVSVDDTDCAHDGGNPGTVNCSFGNITGDGNGNPVTDVNMTLKTSASSGSTISLTATVATDSVDANAGNDSSTQNTTVDDGADLNVVQSDSADPVIAGGNYSYAIDVNNIGPNAASTVSLTNTLPTNVSYVSSSGSGWSCNDSGQVVTCTRSTIANGASAPTVTINAKVTGSVTGTVTNVVTVSSATNDPDLVNNTSSENTLINNGTDLSLTTDVDEPVTGGSTTRFTLRPRNLGPFEANTVTVSNTLPAGFNFISAAGTGWACGESSSTVTCTRSTYSVGSTNNIVIETNVPGTGTNITSTASISSATSDAQPSNNSDSVTFSVVPDGSDLSITKSKSPNPVAQGDNMTSTIRVNNDGPKSTSGTITVTDTLSANETYASFSGTNWSCTHSGGTPTGGDVTCEYVNGSTPISLAIDSNSSTLRIISTATNAGTITNQACVSDVGGEDDNIPSNDCANATAISTAAIADLAITHSVSTDGGDNLLEDDETTITYVVNVANTGDDIIDSSGGGVENGVVITANNIPGYVSGETTFTAAVTGGTQQNFTCTASSNDARCVLNDGETFSGSDNVEVTIITSRGLLDVTNASYTASVSSSILGESNKSDNSASVNVTIEPIADIELQSFTISPSTAEAGTDATYVLTYINNGPSSAKNVVVTHEFVPPASRTYELMSSSSSKGSCNALSGNTLTCNVGTLSRNETETLTLVVRPGWDGTNSSWTLANNASISTTTTESVSGGDNGNNALSENLTVSLAQLDLLVNNTDELDPLGWIPSPGAFPATLDNVIVYKIEMTNRGPSYSTGVTLTDVMTPESGQQVTFLCDGSGNSSCSVGTSLCDNLGASATGPSSITTMCNIPDLEEDEDYTRYLYFRADTKPKLLGDTHNNVATINSNEDDTTPANDSESETTSVRVKLDIGVSITPSKPSVELNEPFNWNIVVTNNGPGDSAESTLLNTLPSGMEITGTPTPAQGTCSGSAGDNSYTCDLGQLNDDENTTITVPVRMITYPSGGTTSNPVTVDTSGVDTNSGNDDDSASVTVTKSSITGTVYNDQNNNGVINSSEHGIAGVTVSISGTDTWGNTVNESEVTDSDGGYTFNNLPSSTNYVITEAQPNNFNDGLDNASGTVVPNSATSDVISSITLVTDTVLTAYDFGNLGLASLAGSVWNDLNNDGNRDAEEILGISGVLITLTGSETVSGEAINLTTTTDTNGDYQFRNITAGTYVISETQPITWRDGSEQLGNAGGSTSNDVFSNVVVTATQSATDYSFGEQGGTLSGKVYRDANNNGAIDTGEAAIPSVTVTLTGLDADSNDITLTTTTNNSGDYSFTGVPASNGSGYTISEVQPQLVFDGLDTLGSLGGVLGNDQFTGVVFSANSNAMNYNFGEGGDIRSSISGFVYIDDNSNGLKDVNERALENITVTLTGTSAIGAAYNRVTTTDITGYYQFVNITASDASGYIITQSSPTAYIDGFESVDGVIVVDSNTTDAFTNIQINDDENIQNYNFAELYKGKVSGTVFIDDDNNGLFEITEEGIEQVNLTLTGTDIYGQSVSYTTTSTANGLYEFVNVIPSDITGYTITEAQPEGYIDSFESVGANLINGTDTTDVHTGLVIALETELAEYNFGERLRSSITGVVFNDVNDDGIQSSEEPGIEGVELVITGTNYLDEVVNITVTTNENGEYLFSDLLASNEQGYLITESQPEAFLDGLDSENGIITPGSYYTDAFTLHVIGGTDYTGFHFAELPTSSISGSVWVDSNNNGIVDEDESLRVNNVTITLVGTEGYEDSSTNNENSQVTQTVTTDENGVYQFTRLRTGEYTITQTQPTAWLDGLDSVGDFDGELSNDEVSGIELNVGDQAQGYNFGERGSQLSGLVFNDVNDNALQESTESGIPSVTIQLTGVDIDNQPVNREVLTLVDGQYHIIDIPLSNSTGYTLTEIQPESVDDGQDILGDNGGSLLNDVVENIVFEEHITLAKGYNFSELLTLPSQISGMVWIDGNHNRTQDEDTGLGGWTVELIDTRANPLNNSDLTPIATVVTATDGEYLFDGLSAGTYEVRFIHPQTETVYGYPNSTEADVDLTFGTIRNLTIGAGEHIEEQDLPIDPSGVVYDSKTREPVAGATVTITGPSGFDPDRDLVGGTNNIVQITDETGLYQYLLFNSAPSGVYRLNIVEPNGYVAGVSQSIPACVNTPIITASPNPVLVQNQDTAPALSAEIHDSQSCATTSADFANNSDSTQYYLSFNINPQLPSGNILNNHIPVDPYTDEMFSLIKTSSTKNASRGDIVPYTISINNNQNYALANINIVDQLPPGFKYIQGSATIDGFAIEPTQNGRQITWSDLTFTSNEQRSIELMTRIGSGVSEGEYVNQAWAYLNTDDTILSDIADATVRIVPDPLFDCSDIVGKVFNDENANGYQDNNEQGLPAVRLATAKGLLVTTDRFGKYHIACAAVPNEYRGSNFILKVDERTLPSGFRITTENPRVVRLTRGKLVKANFGATIHRVIRIQLTDAAFIRKTLNQSYMNHLHQAINALKGKPSIIRLAYAQSDESNELVNERIQTIENIIEDEWDKCDCNYELIIEKEVYQSNKIPNVLQKLGGTDHE